MPKNRSYSYGKKRFSSCKVACDWLPIHSLEKNGYFFKPVHLQQQLEQVFIFDISDIKDGNLKAILGLFFSLSRYKQQQKAASQQQQHNVNQNTVTASDANNPVTTTTTTTNTTSGIPKSGRQTPNSNANTEMLSR